jgi:molybdenum cofactor biosynthesis protein B
MGHDKHGHDHSHHGHHHHHDHDHDHDHRSKAASEHKGHAPAQVATYVVTCSDSRDQAHDESGAHLKGLLERAGHPLAGYRVTRDEPQEIRAALDEALKAGARAVLFNGGTGIGRRDNTVDVLEPLFEKRLPGFGELFRRLSYKQIGSAAMLSRACAGTFQGMIVFALPGSPQAQGLAMEKLILPELGHLVRELTR